MSSADNDESDFRARAVAESKAMLRSLPTGLSPEKSGISYCLVKEPSYSHLRTPIKATALVCAVLGLSGLVLGGVTCLVSIAAETPSLLAIALCCWVGGTMLMFLPVFVERHLVRTNLCRRDDFGAGFDPAGIHISVENAATERSLKILAEDVGLIYMHPEADYVKIDGLSYEYVVHSQDVVDLSLHRNLKNVLLSYRIGEERLDLVVKPRSLLAELKRQRLGSSRDFFEKIQGALRGAESNLPPVI
ncbi:MAG TPA: hypothetical protein VG055_33260 [Planctomycetaceae bacterium]|jgi:hypothetical protein|nr:hypothetical protein [Planctomycetaceae bacterium]